jgi:hypothetical protein
MAKNMPVTAEGEHYFQEFSELKLPLVAGHEGCNTKRTSHEAGLKEGGCQSVGSRGAKILPHLLSMRKAHLKRKASALDSTC